MVASLRSLPQAGRVQTRVFDVRGRVVATLEDAVREAGRHFVRWDGTAQGGDPVAAGVYFLRAESAGETAARKVLRLP